ncbi:hypothetical protein GT3570_02835 [Geobacillus thermoleovorans]|uniref:glutaredoxin family protein n=1 Tax=Geobacillus thermoleovorans TaxID=33941 RepID=UPI00078B6D0A|nr:hypothetical protein GT3570_02835 [Geobacillus thermoleovorans]
MNYILYVIDGCHKCHQARTHLIKEQIPFQEINILKNHIAAKELKEKIQNIVAPVLIAGEDVLVGDKILSATKKRRR